MKNNVRDSDNVHARLRGNVERATTNESCHITVGGGGGKTRLSNGGAPGEDGVSPAMINAAGKPMEEALTAMLNVCWEECKLPERWGKARVRMLYKMGTKSDVGNYREISLLSVLSKLYEMCA
jgi:hypothetical protein